MTTNVVANVSQRYPVAISNNSIGNSKRPDLVERMADATADNLTSLARVAGQLYEAFDTVHFNDGVMRQKLRSIQNRKEYWNALAKKYELTQADVEALKRS
jgi:hypothetical protein